MQDLIPWVDMKQCLTLFFVCEEDSKNKYFVFNKVRV